MVSRVVVTGSSGMLGRNLVARFAADGWSVTGLDIAPGGQQPSGVREITGDIRDSDAVGRALEGADLLVHCAAALPSYPAEEIRSIVVGGTRTLLTAARRLDVPRVVHISSTAVYGLPEIVPTPETHPYAPVDHYSRAKAEAEALALGFRDEGMVLPVLRPKTFVGPGRMGLFSMLFEWAEEGRNFPVLGRGDVRIQMLAIDDLVDAVLLAATAPASAANDTFNVAAAEFGTLREDFQAVLDEAGHGKRIVSVPAGPALAALQLLQKARLSPVYGRLLQKLRADSYVSTDRIRDTLGFVPRSSNRDAILATYRWWREQPRGAQAPRAGRTSRDPWRQGALGLAKVLF
ncbi:NAD-dependent epimerase/dehydratase family protein [Streptomyces sp. WI04-05B]|uniref:NAD-dependent epimerase/dehydratase family protein n=1 Tax=Streptomyces TaxID=1883 RepID=UPI0029AF335E|nr:MULTISPECIES: NAD-dependent epimerase/dehydratase family protein [unclassified Streptomyces]MDX2542801.1 NAD-dependent epimerase/dehydratase family protein [Streptomyces sp. WI04-05B]MDX2588345.1 NAD-dependent epimerase/dehydratase family protein [Streptomyces sp. WI04-05A]MDX3747361.1 NAD-dependent epimerase/dehydratase family protein [Streptomyces sp. AK08-02]